MAIELTIDRNFDVNSRNCPETNEIKDRGGTFFMVGDSRLVIYDAADRTELRYWNEKTSAWESTWDDVFFPLGSRFLGVINSRRAMIGEVNMETGEIVDVHPFFIRRIDEGGSMHIDKQPILHFPTPIRSVHLSFDTDYLFALSATHVYYWNADTPSTPPVSECPLRHDYRGVPIFARGSSLYFLYDGNAATMDEFDGSCGEWARWSLGHADDGLLPNLSGLRHPIILPFSDRRNHVTFSAELITVFAVSLADNSLWSLDVYDLFWKLLGSLDEFSYENDAPVEIVSADGRTVYVRAGEETAAVAVVPDYNMQQETTDEVEEEVDEETKELRIQLDEVRVRRTSQLVKLRRIGVMLLQAGVDQKALDSIETGFDQTKMKMQEMDFEEMQLEIDSFNNIEQHLYTKKLLKFMNMLSLIEAEKKDDNLSQSNNTPNEINVDTEEN